MPRPPNLSDLLRHQLSILIHCWILCPGALFAIPSARSADDARRPNIVVILADDLGYADLGCQGAADIKTPNIDGLVSKGVRCTSGYAAAPVGGPTRAALFTGRYPQRFGFEFNPPRDAKSEYGLPLTDTTLAASLKSAGYATCLVGKWHLGNDSKRHPQSRGFQDFFGFLDGAHYYLEGQPLPKTALPTNGPWPSGMLRGNQPAIEQEYLTDAFTREAVAFIDKHQKQPFFLVASYNAPHAPLEAPDKYINRVVGVTGGDHRRRVYAAMITALDDGVGAIQAKLQSAGVLDDTLIFFLSDNGGITGYLSPSSNAPLIGAKTELLEGGIRVPFFVHWPAKLPAGKIFQPMVSVLDIAPTVLAAAGITAPNNPTFDGVDLTPFLTGKSTAAPHEALFWRYGPLWAIREGNYKLLKVRDDPAQLFNLANDIGEQRDVSANQSEIIKRLQQRYDKWSSELIPPAWSHPNTPPWW